MIDKIKDIWNNDIVRLIRAFICVVVKLKLLILGLGTIAVEIIGKRKTAKGKALVAIPTIAAFAIVNHFLCMDEVNNACYKIDEIFKDTKDKSK